MKSFDSFINEESQLDKLIKETLPSVSFTKSTIKSDGTIMLIGVKNVDKAKKVAEKNGVKVLSSTKNSMNIDMED